jgi:PAS domain S-box-containing protein
VPSTETAALLHATDWSRTALGPMDQWPQCLRLAVGICQSSRFPMFVWWGPQLINIYNDAYVPMLGQRHPRAFGRPARDSWDDIWSVVGPQADTVMAKGEATWNERVRLVMERHGYSEETWFTWSYSPILDESGAIGGLFCAVKEETPTILAERERDRLLERVESERARLASAFSQSPAFLAVLRGPEHVFEFANERYYDLIGRRDLVGKPVREAVPELGSQGFFDLLDRVYGTGEAYVGTNTRVLVRRPPGDELEAIYLDFVYQPMRDAQGAVEGILAHGIDVTEKTRAEGRDRFLLALDEAVRPLTDPAAITAASARRLAEYLDADRCAYADVAEDEDTVDRVGAYTLAGPDIALHARIADYGEELRWLLRAGRSVVVRDVETHEPPLGTLAAYRNARVRAMIVVPLLKAGRLVGTMGVQQRTPRTWTPDEVELVRQVASRCWESIERARVERTLRESEARFRQLADAMPQIVYTARPDGHVDYFNRQWYEYTGLPEGSIGLESWKSVHTAEGLLRVLEVWPEALRSGEPYEIEYPLRRHDGVYRWHLGRALPIKDDEGRVVRWFGTNTDIHALREMKDAVASEKRVLEKIATGAPLPEALEEIARGAEAQSSEGMLCSILVLDEAGERLRHGAAPSLPEAYNQAIDGEPIGPSVGSCGTAAFQRRPVFVTDIANDPLWEGYKGLAAAHGLAACCSTPVIGSDGTVLGTVAMYYREPHHPGPHDVELIQSATRLAGIVLERELVDRRLRQSLEAEQAARAEAERAGRMKDEFLATLSHELRTPLTAILGWTRILRLKPDLSGDILQGVDVIERNARAQTTIIQDLLDMSAIISGKVRLSVQPVDLPALVQAALDTAMPAAQAKQIRIESALDPEAGLPITGDPSRLQQVLWNLLTNAVKFTPREGRIRVVLERVGAQVEVRVSDSGAGIAPEFLPHVFDRFRQADASTTRRYGGLGLGLSIVKQLVELHGGSVSASSEGPGRGATFVVTLPVSPVSQEMAPAAASVPPSPSSPPAAPAETYAEVAGLRVLLVDDDADAREMVKRLLEERRSVVATAGSAEEALRLLRESQFDVLISDIGMPGEDGHALIRQVRSLGPEAGGDVPAVALTAYARPEDRTKAMRAGYQVHAAKPVEPGALFSLIARLARRA